jgi:transposase
MGKLQLYPELSAARLHQMLAEQGFTGSYSLVKQTVAELRPRLRPVYQNLVFGPGECAQVDWGVWKALPVSGGVRRLSFFTMVMCHSRMLYAEFFYGEALEFWLAAHRNALEFFGGVPEAVMVDNCKTAVIVPGTHGQAPEFNAAYAELAHHYNFTIKACTPHRPNEKGRVERAVGYIKSSFLGGRSPATPEALNLALHQWLHDTANVRVHRTTKKRPCDVFADSEKAKLRPLPSTPHPCAVEKNCVANSTCRVTVGTNRYSIPPQFASQRLQLQLYAERIVLLDRHNAFVANHARCFDRGRELVDPAHAQALQHYTRRAKDNRELTAFLGLSNVAPDYLAALKEKRVNALQHVRRINALLSQFGRDAVARALMDTHEHGAYSADYVLNLLEAKGRMTEVLDSPLHIVRNADLLELQIDEPDLNVYDQTDNEEQNNQHDGDDDEQLIK